MSAVNPQSGETPLADELSAIRDVLVVDDSRAHRRILSVTLSRQGYRVREAGSGEEALAICQSEDVDLILSDWMMPGMSGLDLCQAFRALGREKYGYFILLTSKTEKGSVAQGLNAGADDFLSKPVNSEELRARINAGERILRMEREMGEKNRLVSAALAEISTLYDSLDRDLIEARKMQLSLLRESFRDFGSAEVSLMLKPCGHVGGDLVGFFGVGEDCVAVYAIDVSGHGIASALLTARLASYLSGAAREQNIALVRDERGRFLGRPPREVAELLNIVMLEDIRTDLYFTLLLAYVDLNTGRVAYTQCGHPNPAIIRTDGSVAFFGTGGMPVGLIDDAEYSQGTFHLNPGERLLLYSDGFTECGDKEGILLDEPGFERLIGRNADLRGGDFFEALVWDLDMYSGTRDFTDDLSCAVIEYKGGAQRE